MKLALNITGMNGLAGVLDSRIAHDIGLARFFIYFDVADMDREARARAARVDIGAARDLTTRFFS